MRCCSTHAASASRLFSFFARSYRRRFRKKGFEKSQRLLIEGLMQQGIDGRSILEIGCGVGNLHQSLLEQGAARAVGVDLAPAMIAEAKDWASQRGLSERTDYHTGDFTQLADELPGSDITLLDKVVCCDPDADRLVHTSLQKTGVLYALIYPRKRWYVKAGVLAAALLMKLLRSAFRPYLHDPEQIESWICAQGFDKTWNHHTAVWHVQIYRKQGT